MVGDGPDGRGVPVSVRGREREAVASQDGETGRASWAAWEKKKGERRGEAGRERGRLGRLGWVAREEKGRERRDWAGPRGKSGKGRKENKESFI
jgi:hypothetical protein